MNRCSTENIDRLALPTYVVHVLVVQYTQLAEESHQTDGMLSTCRYHVI